MTPSHEGGGGQAPDYAIGMEGGIDGFAADETMTCFAYIAILSASAAKGEKEAEKEAEKEEGEMIGIAKTATFDIPPQMAALVRGGMELVCMTLTQKITLILTTTLTTTLTRAMPTTRSSAV